MSNMSYCRFGNTLEDLKDCRDTMMGMDHYYQRRSDLSDEEFENMECLIDVCRDIVKIADNENHVFIE